MGNAAASQIQINNFDACVEDIKKTALRIEDEPQDPSTFEELTSRLESASKKFPPLYKVNVTEPFIRKIHELGSEGFQSVLRRDPSRLREAGLMMDIAQAILQKGEGYLEKPTAAFQEVVSDLYDGFLSGENRRVIGLPQSSIVAPLIKWGRSDIGPYTWPASATRIFDVKASIVSMPPSHAEGGLLAWTSLAHETAGHDVMSANPGMLEELSVAVQKKLRMRVEEWKSKSPETPEEKEIIELVQGERPEILERFVEYWTMRVDEVASDVLGILNMGPMAAIGVIAYLKAMNKAWENKTILRHGRAPYCEDPHPMDLMRGYLAIATVKRLKLSVGLKSAPGSESVRDGWVAKLNELIATDEELAIKDKKSHTVIARETADTVADVIMNHPFEKLAHHAFSQIQNWEPSDDMASGAFQERVQRLGSVDEGLLRGYYAAHVVAGAVNAALSKKDAEIPLIFSRMLGILKQMHEQNPSWGPLYVEHPGDLVTMRMYVHLSN